MKKLLTLLLLSSLGSSGCYRPVEPLAGTEPLKMRGDVSAQMQESVDNFLLERLRQPDDYRTHRWSRDYSSKDNYVASVAKNRERFSQIIGLADERERMEAFAGPDGGAREITEQPQFTVEAVRWPVFPGVQGEGLLLTPKGKPRFHVVAIPDADWMPEVLVGLAPGPHDNVDVARRLAEAGGQVLVPQLISRDSQWSGNPDIQMLNQPHREFIYRPAFYLGRHIIGYEVQKVLAAVDHFAALADDPKVAVVGYGEGGLIALYSAAVDQRIDVAFVSGYFSSREGLWQEPIYRNVWGLLREFGDGDIASLVAPRALVIEASQSVEVAGPPEPPKGSRDYAATGKIETPAIASVRSEFNRTQAYYEQLKLQDQCKLVESDGGAGRPFSDDALREFLHRIDSTLRLPVAQDELLVATNPPDAVQRHRRQFDELVAFNQRKFLESSQVREAYWQGVDRSSSAAWEASVAEYRSVFLEDVIGDWPIETVPPRPRTRMVYETEQWKGYEVVLDVTDEIWTNGLLLVPNDINADERRPVVVAQHGRGGNPHEVCDPDSDHPAYHAFGARLAERGFVVYAPQNLFFGEEDYRLIQRKANSLGISFFAPMVWQHRATLAWLGQLPIVDAERVGFYGISYGGKSSLWIPAVVPEYSLSICSGAFTNAVKKHIDSVTGNRSVFLFTNEYEHLEFDFAERFNHAEVAWLISPRPFMVEKGHQDGGLPDAWTVPEFARVQDHYRQLGVPDQAEIELFDGGHEINQQGTYDFLHRHLGWEAGQ